MAFRQELDQAQFAALTAAATDAEIITAHARYLISRAPAPYQLCIDHDWRQSPCPVIRDWKSGALCCYTTQRPAVARQWIAEAMTLGYSVTRALGRSLDAYGYGSLADIRTRLTARRIRAETGAPDDDIPF